MIGERNPVLADTGQLLAPLGDELVFVLLLICHLVVYRKARKERKEDFG